MCAIIIQQINSSALKACAQLVVLNVCYKKYNHTTDKQFCLEGLRSTGSAKPVCYNLYDKYIVLPLSTKKLHYHCLNKTSVGVGGLGGNAYLYKKRKW